MSFNYLNPNQYNQISPTLPETLVVARDVLLSLHRTAFLLLAFGLRNDARYREQAFISACGRVSHIGINWVFPPEEEVWHVSVRTGQEHVVEYIAVALQLYAGGVVLLGPEGESRPIAVVPGVTVAFRAVRLLNEAATAAFVLDNRMHAAVQRV